MSSAGIPPLISIVIPVFNEEQTISILFAALRSAIESCAGYRWELVLVDDGSADATVAEIERQRPVFPGMVSLVQFSRNFGHQPALTAGLQRSKGDAVVCMDADLQDPPSLLPQFLDKFAEGYDVVYAVRTSRVATGLIQFLYGMFYRCFRFLSEVEIPLDAGDFGLMSRRVVNLLIAIPERDVMVRGLRSWVGFRQIGIPYDRPGRAAGETKYSFGKLVKLAMSGFFGFSTLPLRVATFTGVASMGMALLYFLFALYAKLFRGDVPQGWTSLVGIILILAGAQLISVGILGEYIGRIHAQLQGRPLFVVHSEREL
jgi:dolichol-phosphate mannosyltransferase